VCEFASVPGVSVKSVGGRACGMRLSAAPMPFTEMMYKFLAPVLSAQFITAAT